MARMEPISPIRPLLLGSASPRRRELLASAGVSLVTVAPSVDEGFRPNEAPDAYLERVCAEKLAAAWMARGREAPCALVADTVVIENASLVDKPTNADEARAALERLSGRTHEVATRFVLGAARGEGSTDAVAVVHAQTVRTRVTMRPLSEGEIAAYVASREGFDKAGGYGIQGGAAGFVSRVEGSYTNVVGLPLAEVIVALRSLGFLE